MWARIRLGRVDEAPRSAGPMSRRLGAAVVLATAAGCASAPVEPVAVAPPPAPPPAPIQLADADRVFEGGDYARAARAYDAVLARSPDNGTAWYNKGLALQRAGDFGGAQAAYERALQIDPNDVEAALNLGAVQKELGDHEGAIALYRRFLDQDEFNPRLLNNLAALYRAQGAHDEGIGAVRKLLMRDKNNVDAYKNLALIYFDQKKYKLAQTVLDNALSMAKTQNKTEPDIYVNLGRVLLQTGKPAQAMAAFRKATRLQPNHVVANYNIGALALGHRDYRTAAAAYEICATAWPQKYDVWASLGFAYQGLKAFTKAEQHLAKSRRLLRGHADAVAEPSLKQRLYQEDEQMLLQLVSTAQAGQQTQKALGYADEYLQRKGLTCEEDDTDGFCGRYNGIRLTLELEREATEAPAPETGG